MQTIDLKRFSSVFAEAVLSGKMSFAFFLGAGCSISSGILPASTLCLQWVRELERDQSGNDSPDFEEWYAKSHPGFTRENAGAFYATVIQERFPNPALRRMAVQDFVSARDPGFGYAALSALITNVNIGPRCNVVFTTNFDDLVADALFLFQHVKALVIPHEDLASYATASSGRPLIVKVHGDANLSPLNTPDEIEELSKAMSDALRRKLDDRGIVFLGYSGFDRSVTKALKRLPKNALPNGVYWINKSLPADGEFAEWLSQRGAVWVKHQDFDEIMMSLQAKFDLGRPDVRRFKVLLENYEDESERLRRKLDLSTANLKPSRAAIEKELKKHVDDFRRASSDPSQVRELIDRNLSKYRKSPDLLGICAQYMRRQNLRDFAEQLYQEALTLDPDHANVLCGFAGFIMDDASKLADRDKALEEAERLLRRACASNPTNAQCLGSMASFYWTQRKDGKRASPFYERALQVDRTDPETLASYANFIWRAYNRREEAIKYYERSMDINPGSFRTLANFSQVLFLSNDSAKDRRTAHSFASSVVTSSGNKVLQLEALFYLFAHHPHNPPKECLKNLRKLIDEGFRSPDWDLSPTVKCAAELQHPQLLLLQTLSEVISNLGEPSVLNQFEAWKLAV
jgi:tetratricopeptide (TPR) repeat protein